MKQSLKTLFLIILVISIVLLGVYIVGQKETEVAKVTVEITKGAPYNISRFNESERDELIGNITLNSVYISKFAEPKGNDMQLPGISVGLFSKKMMISEWTSVSLKDKGIYELTLGLKKPVNKSDVIRIAVYVNDDKGKVIIGKRKDIIWE